MYAAIGLVVAMCLTMYFGKDIISLLELPYNDAAAKLALPDKLRVLDATEGFDIYFRISLYAGLIVAAPWVFYQIWMFISAGLKPSEKKYVHFAVPMSATLFVAGAAFFLFVAAMPSLRFLLWFNKEYLDTYSEITLSNHIEFMTNLMLVFGIAFQTPLAVLLLAKMGLVKMATLRKYRRHVIIVIVIAAGILTPSPSPLDQIILAVPMWMLYELGVFMAWMTFRKKQRLEAIEGRGFTSGSGLLFFVFLLRFGLFGLFDLVRLFLSDLFERFVEGALGAGHLFLEYSQPAAKSLSQFGYLLAAKEQQDKDHYHGNFPRPEAQNRQNVILHVNHNFVPIKGR